MKIIILIIAMAIMTIQTYAQCSITKTKLDDDIAYTASPESIYRNEDLENGLLTAYFQLVVIQNEKNKDLLINAIIMKVASSRPKSPLVPRNIIFYLEDNTMLELSASDLKTSQPISGITQNECNYSLSMEQYRKLQSNKVNRILIQDTRLNTSIVATPFKGLIEEQANCIASKLEKNFQKATNAPSFPDEKRFDYIGSPVDGMAYVKKGNLYGYIDMAGQIVIPIIYEQAYDFNNGAAMVVKKINGKNEIYSIDKKGNKIMR